MRWLSVMLAVAAACSSDGSHPGGDSNTRTVVVGTPATAHGAVPHAQTPAMTPAPHVCPSNLPTACPAACCAAGDTCATDGGCSETPSAGGCPASAPVACATAGTGSTAYDITYRNDIPLPAPTGFVPGKFGTAISTNQSGCPAMGVSISTTSTGLPTGNAAETIEFWLYVPDTAPLGLTGLLSRGDRAIDVYSPTPGNPNAKATIEIGGLQMDVANDSWHFIAISTQPGASSTLVELTMDGTDYGQFPLGTTYATAANAALYLATDPVSAPCRLFSGSIDELRIEDVALAPSQLVADYSAGPLAADAHTVGLWHFDEAEASRCCPAGTTCDATRGCVNTGTTACPVDCGNGNCCQAGQVCTPNGCALAGYTYSCPADHPLFCNGTCCDAAMACGATGCVKADSTTPTDPCAAGDTAVMMDATDVACCTSPFPTAKPTSSSCSGSTAQPTCYAPAPPLQSRCAGLIPYCAADHPLECSLAAQSAASCGAGAPCTGDSTHPGGCCAAGTVCGGPGTCCPSGETTCGAGCCPSGQCVNGSCNPAAPACSPSCPMGTVCNGGDCIAAQEAPPSCPTGTLCGTTCCPSGEACDAGTCRAVAVTISCPANLPEQCGPAGPCCRTDFTCFGNAGPGPSGFYCECVGPSCKAPFSGPMGPGCGADYCDAGNVCSQGECCGQDTPNACGAECCADGEPCVAGACGCPADHSLDCGANCCDASDACNGGGCIAACAGEPACGGKYCCENGAACTSDGCGCPSDHPVACGAACCLPGASCNGDSDCACPDGRVTCGDVCCASGETCTNGTCGTPMPTTCGNGEFEASLRFCAGDALSGACMCTDDPLDTCVPTSGFPIGACTAEHGSCSPDGRSIDRPCCAGMVCAVGMQCAGAGGGECVTLP